MRMFVIFFIAIVATLLLVCASRAQAQSENLTSTLTFDWNSITACMLNRGIWFHKCRTETKQFSEAQIGKIITHGGLVAYCDQQVKRKWTECAGLYPRPSRAMIPDNPDCDTVRSGDFLICDPED